MIERNFVAQKTKEYYIKQYIESKLDKVGVSSIRLKKIPLGEKIIIDTSRPSLIVGSKGASIRQLTKELKEKFHLENPQVEINEVKNIFLDAQIVAERIASSLERFGSARFKGVGHKTLESVMKAGAMGVEIIISGKLPSSRAKNWRFYQGYLKKCGDVSIVGVRKAKIVANLKSGIVGIKVAIMPPDLELPDHVEILEEPQQIIEEIKETKENKSKSSSSKKTTEKKSVTKKTTKKKVTKKAVKKEESILEKVEDVAEKVVDTMKEKVGDVVEKVEEVLHLKEEDKKADQENIKEVEDKEDQKEGQEE